MTLKHAIPTRNLFPSQSGNFFSQFPFMLRTCILVIIAILLPPLAIILSSPRTLCCSLLLNIALCFALWIPAVIHAIYIIFRESSKEKSDRCKRGDCEQGDFNMQQSSNYGSGGVAIVHLSGSIISTPMSPAIIQQPQGIPIKSSPYQAAHEAMARMNGQSLPHYTIQQPHNIPQQVQELQGIPNVNNGINGQSPQFHYPQYYNVQK